MTAGLVLLGVEWLEFLFENSTEAMKEKTIELTLPSNVQEVIAHLQSFAVAYADGAQHGFGEFGVSLRSVGNSSAVCRITLHGGNPSDKPMWGAHAHGAALIFGLPPQG